MAILIPDDRELFEFNRSIGEKEIYSLFRELSDDYIIFHSVRWNNRESHFVKFGEADFVIYHKKYGIICLEVKHGGIKSENGRIYQINTRTNKIVGQIDPMTQAQSSSFRFYELLNKGVIENKTKINSFPAVWFTMVNSGDLLGKLPMNYYYKKNTFFREDLKDIDKAIKECFLFYNVKEKRPSEKRNKLVVDTLSPKFYAFPSMSTIFEQNNLTFNIMTMQQGLLLDYLEYQKVAAIHGAAGTGKTMLALEKAKRLSKNEKVVFLCYNSLLIESLKNRYSNTLKNVTFTNIDTLAFRAYGRFTKEEEKLEFLYNFESYPEIWNFKSIIIDEGQDFSDKQIKMLKDISILNEGSFYIFYDKNQLIQQQSELTWLNEMECQLILSYNCRNTKEIAVTSSSSIFIDDVKIKYEVGPRGKPLFHRIRHKEGLEKLLINRIEFYLKEGIYPKDIVILSLKTIDKSKLSLDSNLYKKYLSSNFEDGKILFTTARKFKGLEADVIILIDFDKHIFASLEQRRVFYVGASRAKNSLEIISVVSNDEESELYNLISGGKNNRMSAVMEALKVKPV